MFAKFFIERPVLANVIALVMMLLGGVAMFNLPVAQYPPITPPTIQVTANYPGANAKTLVETVALPIEQQVNGVENMIYMQSTCTSDGRYTLTVTFKVGTDLDFAQVLVQNRVSAALAQLPQSVQQQGVVTKKKSTAILQIITLTSPSGEYDALFGGVVGVQPSAARRNITAFRAAAINTGRVVRSCSRRRRRRTHASRDRGRRRTSGLDFHRVRVHVAETAY